MGRECLDNLGLTAGGRPPAETSARQTFVAKPESLAIVNQHLQRRGTSVSKHEQRTAKRVLTKDLFTESREPIDSSAEIRGLNGDENAHLRRDLDRDSVSRKLQVSAARSGVSTPLR